MQNKFIMRIEGQRDVLKKNNDRFNAVGYIKLLLILLLCVSAYLTFIKGFPLSFIAVSLTELICLVIIWVYHNDLYEKIKYSNGIIAINERHLDRISGKWVSFQDIGEEFIDAAHPFACDLDIVGQKSLFQFMNTTHTWFGRHAFAGDLLQPRYFGDDLLLRQQAISELSKDIDFTEHMEYYFSKIGVNGTVRQLVDELKDERVFINSKPIKFILKYIPPFIFIFIAAVFVFQFKNLFLAGIILALIQLLIWGAGMPKIRRYLGSISHLPYRLNSYGVIIDILKKTEFSSKKLKKIQEQLGTSSLSAAQAMKELSNISDKVNVCYNGLIYFILNALLLWDYECAFMYEDWKRKYAPMAEQWFLALGEFESLLCFSILPNICNNTCLPAVVNDKTVEAQEMGHPLIHNDVRVNNDIACGNNIFIVSGSNMSGKTTYLRTVGVNMALARAGSFVCAKKMSFSFVNIMTSMRIVDDLNQGVSTFYAELKRIKAIIDSAGKGKKLLFLIDEIFKGTNSVDRIYGAKTVISKLNDLGAAGLISTHDLELCDLADQYPGIKNYSFSEHYEKSGICFDYKIKPGKSATTNAKYLMEMIGIGGPIS